ncbi:MAG: glycosyltransferase [Prevotellaceae bacterium]|nr:glycosyltransferase [Prevotellaceae bacterium]
MEFALKKDENRIKISIVVPVYNVEKYLRQCLDSLVNQTLKDIEIICINDASPDNSLEILQEYAQKDDRIIIINLKENRKQGGARNAGIRIARGEYIALVDSDDWCALGFCEKLWDASENGTVDLVSSDFYIYEQGKTTYAERFPTYVLELTKTERDKYFILYGWFGWPSMLKRKLFFDYQLFYPENRFGEDVAISPQPFCIANRIVKVNISLYYYRIRESSTTNTTNYFPVIDYMYGTFFFFEDMKRLGFYDKYKTEVEARFYRYVYRSPLLRSIFQFSKPQKYYINQIKQRFLKDYRLTKKSYYKHRLQGRQEILRDILLQIIEWNTSIGIFLIRLLWLCKGKIK